VRSLDNLPFNSLDCLENEEGSEKRLAEDLWGGERSRMLGEEVGQEKEYLYSEEDECIKGSDVCQEEWDMPVPGLAQEGLAHLSLATSEMAEGLWGGEKSRILGEEVGEEEEQYSEGEECSAGSEVSQEEWDMPVPGLEEEDLAHLSLATSEMEEGLWRGGAVFRGRDMQQRVRQEGWEYR
jgi:hypothetical protein